MNANKATEAQRNRADERRILSIAGALHDIVSGKNVGSLTMDQVREALAKAEILSELILSKDTEIRVID
jgi:hypothetical protein